MTSFISQLLQQASTSGSRSTVLSDLRWFIAIVLAGLLAASTSHAATWILVLIASSLGLGVILYMLGYLYFGIKDPDALRSEKFKLSKLAIERSATGDDLAGFVRRSETALLAIEDKTRVKEVRDA